MYFRFVYGFNSSNSASLIDQNTLQVLAGDRRSSDLLQCYIVPKACQTKKLYTYLHFNKWLLWKNGLKIWKEQKEENTTICLSMLMWVLLITQNQYPFFLRMSVYRVV